MLGLEALKHACSSPQPLQLREHFVRVRSDLGSEVARQGLAVRLLVGMQMCQGALSFGGVNLV
ncbi:hypothetical protein ABIB53_000568 [Janibacter sp. UYMM211]